MKKYTVVLMGVMLAMSLVACGDNDKKDEAATELTTVAVAEKSEDTEKETTSETETTTEIATQAEVTTQAETTTENVTEATTESTVENTSEAVEETTAEQVTEATESSSEQPASNGEGMLTEEEVNRALTNYIHATYGEDFGEDLPEGTRCYWYVNPEADGIYEGELHSYTGAIVYFYTDAYTGKTDVCERADFSQDPQYVTTVNFKDYL